jgi:hypothetical protein
MYVIIPTTILKTMLVQMGIKVNFSLFDKLEASPVPHMTLSTFNLTATVFIKLLVYFFFNYILSTQAL